MSAAAVRKAFGRPSELPQAAQFTHGTRSRYVTGCRCDECRAANTRAYHDRQARAKAAAAELAAPRREKLAPQVWTAPDGTQQTRLYQRACAGVHSKPCPKGSHLRKDSTGTVCSSCRERLVWNGLVGTTKVLRHLARLSAHGVGYKSVAAAADVGHTTLCDILRGRKNKIRFQSERSVLAVTAEAIADHGIVDAGETWRLLNDLLARGLSKSEIARRLGTKPALQVNRQRVLARTAYAVARLHRIVTTPKASEPAPMLCSCAKPVVFELDDEHFCGKCELRATPEAILMKAQARERQPDQGTT